MSDSRSERRRKQLRRRRASQFVDAIATNQDEIQDQKEKRPPDTAIRKVVEVVEDGLAIGDDVSVSTVRKPYASYDDPERGYDYSQYAPHGEARPINYFGEFGNSAGYWNGDITQLGAADGFQEVGEITLTSNYDGIFTAQFTLSDFPDWSGPGKYLYIAFAANWDLFPAWEDGPGSAADAAWMWQPSTINNDYRIYILRSDGQNGRNEYFRLYYPPAQDSGDTYRIADPVVWKANGETAGRRYLAGGGSTVQLTEPSGPNLLENPGFEADPLLTEQPTGWYNNKSGGWVVNELYTYPDSPGTQSFGNDYNGDEVDGTDGSVSPGVWPNAYLYQDVSISGPEKLHGDAWVRLTNNQSNYTGIQEGKEYGLEDDARIHFKAFDDSDTLIGESKGLWGGELRGRGLVQTANTGSGAFCWIRIEHHWTCPPATETVRFQIDGGDANNAYVQRDSQAGNAGMYIDDARLRT